MPKPASPPPPSAEAPESAEPGVTCGARPLATPKPPYPQAARRLELEGEVRLRVMVDDGGKVKSVAVENSSGASVLDRVAVRWVREHWQFAPAMRDGTPVADDIGVKVVFHLE